MQIMPDAALLHPAYIYTNIFVLQGTSLTFMLSLSNHKQQPFYKAKANAFFKDYIVVTALLFFASMHEKTSYLLN